MEKKEWKKILLTRVQILRKKIGVIIFEMMMMMKKQTTESIVLHTNNYYNYVYIRYIIITYNYKVEKIYNYILYICNYNEEMNIFIILPFTI